LGMAEKDVNYYISSLGLLGAGMYRDSMMYRNMELVTELYTLQQQKFYGFLGFYHCLQTGYEKSTPFAAHLQRRSNTFRNSVVSLQMFCGNCKVLLPYIEQVKKMMPASYVTKLRNDNPEFGPSKKYIPYGLSNDLQMMKVNGIEYLLQLTEPATVTLFQVNKQGSPFYHTKLLAEVSGFQNLKLTDANSKTTDAFQYILFFRNSPAALPIE
jgi:hypothetical protein